MAVMGLRLAGRSNGVAKLHGEVSREMFADLWPDVPVDEVPITSITNGVHAPHVGVARDRRRCSSRYVLPDWDEAGEADWARAADIRDDELWRAREQARERLVTFVREHLRQARLAQGVSVSDVAWTDDRPRPEGAHDRLRPALRHLQAGHPAALPARPPASACCCRPTGPCSSCSPARPTRPTSRARR